MGRNSWGEIVADPGLSEKQFNDLFYDAVVTWVDGQHGWSISAHDVFLLRTFERGK